MLFIPTIRPPFFSLLAAIALAAAALPGANARAQTLKVGDVAVLASYYEIRGSDCLTLRAPKVTITLPPHLGTANVAHTQGQSGDSGRCAYKAVPIAQIVYQTIQPGADTLAWEVKYQNKTLGVRRYSASINVAPATPTAP